MKLLRVYRYTLTRVSTIGDLYTDETNEPWCRTLEDPVRFGPKIAGLTAIPEGFYEVIINFSSRFQRPMPLLLNVPGFDGIRFHVGNTAKDVKGCIALGITSPRPDEIVSSRPTFDRFFGDLQGWLKRQEVWVAVVNPPPALPAPAAATSLPPETP